MASHGAIYVLVLYPDQLQIEDAYQRMMLRDADPRSGPYDFQLPQRLLREFAAAEGILYLDLYDVFKTQGYKGGLFNIRDPHWNQKGHDLAAATIAEFLEAQELVHQSPKFH